MAAKAGTKEAARLEAKKHIGESESNGLAQRNIMNPYNKLTGRHLNVKTVAWCMIYVVMVLILSGVSKSNVYKSSGCTQQLRWYKKKKRFRPRGTKPQASWIVFYNFKNSKTNISTHVGFITSVDYKKKGYMYVAEGNIKGGKVAYRHISYSSKCIVGYGLPYYKT